MKKQQSTAPDPAWGCTPVSCQNISTLLFALSLVAKILHRLLRAKLTSAGELLPVRRPLEAFLLHVEVTQNAVDNVYSEVLVSICL